MGMSRQFTAATTGALAICLAPLFGCGGTAESPDAAMDLAMPVGAADLAMTLVGDLEFSDAATATCPATMPTGACSSGGLSCGYQSTTCDCVAPEMTWACCGPSLGPACPFSQPTNGSPCCIQQSTSPMCGYACGSSAAETCTCNAMHWNCVAGGC